MTASPAPSGSAGPSWALAERHAVPRIPANGRQGRTRGNEAAHGAATARGKQDTSRQGGFHNTRYRALAEELGLAVAKADPGGWSGTTVPDATAALYRAELRRLDEALVAWRHADGRRRGSNNNGIAACCSCGATATSTTSRSAATVSGPSSRFAPALAATDFLA